jgi:ribosomal protein S18 acetylase RimI-like enzyme
MESYEVVSRFPDVADYRRIRVAAGLKDRSAEAAEKGLQGTWFGVSVLLDDAVIGIGRIIGDGGCFFQVVDIAVVPEHQGKGIGKKIMAALTSHLEQHAPPSAYVSLIADGQANHLYRKFGFTDTAPESIGMYRRF